MSDEFTQKRQERADKLELLQEIYYILHHNALQQADRLLKAAIERNFTGKLELLIEPDKPGWRRDDVTISMRLISPEQPERPGCITYPVDPATLRDMYERLKPQDTEPQHTPGPVVEEVAFDCSAQQEAKGEHE